MANMQQPTRFDILLGAVKAVDEGGSPRIICTASSDVVDLGVDRFMLSALEQMAVTFPGMAIFLNHKYVVPEDVFGAVTKATIVDREGHHDLDLEIAVDTHNERAMVVYRQIQSGVKLGVSVGVLVLDAEYSSEKVDGKKILNIKSVNTLEASIVGIPANRRSWVQGALKAASMYFEGETRELLEKLANSIQTSDGGTVMELDELAAFEKDEDVQVPTPEEDVEDAPTPDEEGAEEDEPEIVEDAVVEMAPVLAEVTDSPAVNAEAVETIVEDSAEQIVTEPEAELAVPEERPEAESVSVILARQRLKHADKNRKWYDITVKDAEPDDLAAETEDSVSRVAEVLIYDSIGGAETTQAFVNAVDSLDVERINLRINSPGGIIDDGIAIRNALSRNKADVYTYVEGLAASMASIIAMVGKECIMAPDSMMMIHEPWGCAMGDASIFEKEARILNKYANQLAGVYANKAGGDREEWRDVMRIESWYSAEEAVDAGLAERVGGESDGYKAPKKKPMPGEEPEEEPMHKGFDVDIFTLFKNAPVSAKRFFTREFVPELVATVDPTEMTQMAIGISGLSTALRTAQKDNDSLRDKLLDKETAVTTLETERATLFKEVQELMVHVNRVLDTPMPRKTGDAYAQAINEIASKWPWLDERIIAQMARDPDKTT